MSKVRIQTEALLHLNNPPPESLDYLEFRFKGVTFRCFGILHGITGGLNRGYREFIKKSIRDIDGVKLAEKGMKQLYPNCGIDKELEDWLVLRPVDCMIMGFQLLADPRCLWMITIDALREKFRKHDPFITQNRKNINHLGESTYFHYLDELERRDLVGFLPSQQAISQDLSSMSKWYKAILPKPRHSPIQHAQWKRILLLERLMHIPCRSIHMLYYALAYATENNIEIINLFVGETHNTDMQYLASKARSMPPSFKPEQITQMNKIHMRADYFGRRAKKGIDFRLIAKKINYLLFLLTGATLALFTYFLIYNFIIN